MTAVASGRCMRNQQCVAEAVLREPGGDPEPGLPVLPVDELGDSGFDVGLQLLHLVPHDGSPLILGLAVAHLAATPLRRCLTAPARRDRSGVKGTAVRPSEDTERSGGPQWAP